MDHFLLFMFRVCHAFLSVQCSCVVTCLTLLCVDFCCVLSLSHEVSWVRCGTCLYRFLIFASFLTLNLAYCVLACIVSWRWLVCVLVSGDKNISILHFPAGRETYNFHSS